MKCRTCKAKNVYGSHRNCKACVIKRREQRKETTNGQADAILEATKAYIQGYSDGARGDKTAYVRTLRKIVS